jgi:hypothetical protein
MTVGWNLEPQIVVPPGLEGCGDMEANRVIHHPTRAKLSPLLGEPLVLVVTPKELSVAPYWSCAPCIACQPVACAIKPSQAWELCPTYPWWVGCSCALENIGQ